MFYPGAGEARDYFREDAIVYRPAVGPPQTTYLRDICDVERASVLVFARAPHPGVKLILRSGDYAALPLDFPKSQEIFEAINLAVVQQGLQRSLNLTHGEIPRKQQGRIHRDECN